MSLLRGDGSKLFKIVPDISARLLSKTLIKILLFFFHLSYFLSQQLILIGSYVVSIFSLSSPSSIVFVSYRLL